MDDQEEAITAFFAGRPEGLELFCRVRRAVERAGPAALRVTKSQVAFSRRRGFAWTWTPDRWLRGQGLAPLVLSIALPRQVLSRRIKEVVEPRPGHFMHHLELRRTSDVDATVRAWLHEAWLAAAPARRDGRKRGKGPQLGSDSP